MSIKSSFSEHQSDSEGAGGGREGRGGRGEGEGGVSEGVGASFSEPQGGESKGKCRGEK